jgi:nucleotide-binding universal stress UspA family protein
VAQRLAGRASVGVELVTVCEPGDRADVERRLAEAAERASPGTTSKVLQTGGPVRPALLTEMHAREKELWCVGSHARGALGELLLGSVSEDLVRTAHLPIALVGPNVDASSPGEVMAVALDGSEESEVIVPVAADLAGVLGMSLRLLQVGEPTYRSMPMDVSETAYVSQVASRIPAFDPRDVDYEVLHGTHPAHDLADYVATRPELGMIAVATRGLSGRARVLHGSTSFELAHRAVVPVVVLHHE